MSESAFDVAVKTVRFLSVDGVEKAKSGHPGTPMALAGIGVEIFTRYLRYVPDDPNWPNRDRFVLSCGHASMLLYSLLHLAGYDLPLDELKKFRQWGSKTPGHPEHGLTPGVETTTGPLGQGVGNAIGLALAEQDGGRAGQRGRRRAHRLPRVRALQRRRLDGGRRQRSGEHRRTPRRSTIWS